MAIEDKTFTKTTIFYESQVGCLAVLGLTTP